MSYNWLIGFGVMFGFALAISYISDYSIEKFLGYLAFFNAFMVWIEFLPIWSLVLNILVLVFIIIGKGKGGI